MKKAHIYILLLIITSGLKAQTEVGGAVSGLWTSFGSPYQIVANVEVSADDTLVIESNTIVDMGSEFTLRVEGTLIASNTLFRNGGELFAAGGQLILSSCEFRGLNGGIVNYGGISEIYSCFVDSTSETGITLNGTDSSFIYNSLITNSGDYGIKVRGTNAVEIISNTLSGNSNDYNHPALYFDSASPQVVQNNIIEDNRAQGIGIWSLSEIASPIIQKNIIRRNFTGITLVNSPAFIENNIIVANYQDGNFDSGAGIYAGYANSTPIVMNNYIAGNYYGVSNINSAACNLGDMVNDYPGDDGLNIFYNNTFNGSTWNIWNGTAIQLLAQNNYWPGLELVDVDATLYDNEEGGGEVVYLPIYAPTLPMPADLNDDTMVNILDVVLMIEILLSPGVADGILFYLSDFNNDYNLDVTDVIATLEFIAGE